MKKLISSMAMIAVLIVSLAGCTEQTRAKRYGGIATVELSRNTKLVIATWKEDSIWYLTRPMRPDEKPERYEFTESSSFGIIEGKVIIVEQR